MRHNKFIGWDRFFDVMEQVERMSPWLSRQISKRVSEWPFWFFGAKVRDWKDGRVWVNLPQNLRNSMGHEICQGYLLLAAELTVRLSLVHFRREFPFRYRLYGAQIETHHAVDQAVDIRFELSELEREKLRLELARESKAVNEFVLPVCLSDGRLAATVTLRAAFDLEKFLPA